MVKNLKYLEMIEFIKDKQIDVQIFEGVTNSFVDDDYEIIASNHVLEYETDYASQLINKVSLNDYRIIYFNSYIMAGSRFESIMDLSNTIGDKLVITNATYTMMNEVISKDILILNKDITIEEIINASEKYIIDFDYNDKETYTNIKESTLLLQTGGEPLGDYDPRFAIFKDFCEFNNITFYPFGLGGHASPENLKWLANSIETTYTFPLHSFKPYMLKPDNSIQILPVKDYIYSFTKHNLN